MFCVRIRVGGETKWSKQFDHVISVTITSNQVSVTTDEGDFFSHESHFFDSIEEVTMTPE